MASSELQALLLKIEEEREDRKNIEQEALSILRQFKKRYDDIIYQKDLQLKTLPKATIFEENEQLKNLLEDARIQLENMDTELKKCRERQQFTREINLDLRSKIAELEKRTGDTKELKEIITQLEKQLDDSVRLLSKKTEEYNQLRKEKQTIEREKISLMKEVESLKSEFSIAREKNGQELNDLRNQVKQLEKCLEQKNQCVETISKNLEEEVKKAQTSGIRIAGLEQDLKRIITEASAADLRIEELEEQNLVIKEEAARHISECMAQRSENTRLTYELEHAKNKADLLKGTIRSLQDTMEQEKQLYETEIYKLSERLRQDFDLESEMMNKINKLEKAKKVSTSRVFFPPC